MDHDRDEQMRARHDALVDAHDVDRLCHEVAAEFEQLAHEEERRRAPRRNLAARLGRLIGWRRSDRS